MVIKKPKGENDAKGKTSDDEEENPKALGENRDKTMTATWDTVELGASTTLLQGETIDKGVFMILLKVLALGNKETAKLGYRRGKEKHGIHDRKGEEMLKDDEQSQFKKLGMRTRNELCLDDMESP